MKTPMSFWLTTLALCAALAAGGCATQADLSKAELATLSVELPGNYGNQQQLLTILRLSAPLIGDHVFFVRETAANDVRRVISERIWSLEAGGDAHLIGTVYAFDEPERWRNGADDPELFRSLLLRDLRSLPGCTLIWEKSASGFSAASANERCPQHWQFEGDELAFSEHPGAIAPPESYFRFTRVQ
jgi:hypothetical protein